MSETKEDLKTKVYKWLLKQGYPLEMTVANAFREVGFQVTQSEYYSDPETEEAREIDIVASDSKSISRKIVKIKFVVECKVSKDKPWVLFSSSKKGLPGHSKVVQRAGSKLGIRLLRSISDLENIQDLSLFRFSSSPAYGMTQAFTSGKDICYSAAMAVAKATLASISKADEVPKDFASRIILNRTSLFEIIFPVIVIEGRLFEAYLSEESPSDLKVSEVDQGILLWRNPIVGRRFTIINVINTNYLNEFCQNAKDASELILKKSDKEILDGLIEQEKKKGLISKPL